MTDLYAEGRKADDETVEELMARLALQKNYIPSSDRAHREYAYVLLKEYRKYVKGRDAKSGPQDHSSVCERK